MAATLDVSSTLGNVVTAHDAVDLPLNGRNLTQLGLLQPGVAPLTSGLLQAGGIARANQALRGEWTAAGEQQLSAGWRHQRR